MNHNPGKASKKFVNQETFRLIIVSAISLFAMYFGWKLFWFLTDDAFIAFRYVSNSHQGYGYVWNPPPFLPVEGYTSFLWVFILDVVWRIFSIEPPSSANWISLLFACLSLLIIGLMVLKMKLASGLQHWRVLLLSLVLLGTISNRTFLAWSSSGLETAMFNFFIVLWIYFVLFLRFGSRKWVLMVSSTAVLIYLTRPDGLLFVAATFVLILFALANKKRHAALSLTDLALLSPFLGIPAHLLWRYATYGEWLPNTYYAKSATGRILLDSGLNYLLSFILEYSLWIWLIVLIVLIIKTFVDWQPQVSRKLIQQYPEIAPIALLPPLTVGIVITAHLGYYTILVGGDHFEFRVYSYVIPLIFVSFIWMLNVLEVRFKGVTFLLALFIVLSWPIPWTHWAASQTFTTRESTHFLKVSVADALQERLPILPNPVVTYLEFYDALQFSLIDKLIAVRHQEHKVFYESLSENLPDRDDTRNETFPNYPVMFAGSLGVISWVYPHVNFIDTYGLNDYVIARNPSLRTAGFMAHERKPPPGYVSCFAPGARQDEIVDVTAERIITCEHIFRMWTHSPELAPALIRAYKEPTAGLNAQFGDYLLLQGYDLETQAETITITLHWKSLQKSDFDYSVFVHLINEQGEKVSQEDHSPGDAQGYPLTEWEPGEQILDSYTLEYSSDQGQVSINLGVYNWQTGERLPTFPVKTYPDGFVKINNLLEVVP